jgi:patatin-like phospholipase/acyl hydrolase
MVYRILSLDGGGTWSLIQVNALIALYSNDTSGHAVLRDFDLVAANSGSSLVLGSLVENLKLGDLYNYFSRTNRSAKQSSRRRTPKWRGTRSEVVLGRNEKAKLNLRA